MQELLEEIAAMESFLEELEIVGDDEALAEMRPELAELKIDRLDSDNHS